MKKLLLSALALATIMTSVSAQDSTKVESKEGDLTFYGSVDTYYRKALDGGNNQAPSTSFAGASNFAIGMVNIGLEKSSDKAGFVADLVFGPRGDDAVFGAVLDNDKIVNQLYAYWNASDKLTLTIGNFNTFLGYEVISPAANFNYSTSYMFSYGPFSHTGIKADYAISDDISAMFAVMNPTDATTMTNVNTPSFGFQLGFKEAIYLNAVLGDQDGALGDTVGSFSGGSLFQIDLTAGFDVTDELFIGVNTSYNGTSAGQFIDLDNSITDIDADASSYFGAALYAQYAVNDALSLGLRGEYFSEANGGYGAIGRYDAKGDGSVIDFTLSANYTVGALTFIPEFRIDMASEDVYLNADSEASSSLASFLLAAVYSF